MGKADLFLVLHAKKYMATRQHRSIKALIPAGADNSGV
jgi:hypothetical protein